MPLGTTQATAGENFDGRPDGTVITTSNSIFDQVISDGSVQPIFSGGNFASTGPTKGYDFVAGSPVSLARLRWKAPRTTGIPVRIEQLAVLFRLSETALTFNGHSQSQVVTLGSSIAVEVFNASGFGVNPVGGLQIRGWSSGSASSILTTARIQPPLGQWVQISITRGVADGTFTVKIGSIYEQTFTGLWVAPATDFRNELAYLGAINPEGNYFSTRLDAFQATYSYTPPVVSVASPVTRQFPRDDGRGHSSAPRIYPPSKSGRVYGGYQ